MKHAAVAIVLSLTIGGASAANAATLHVPGDATTLQEAANAAAAGDRIVVGPGRHCGAVIDRELALVGVGAVIVGCASPRVAGLAAGFVLAGPNASGTSITGFIFDGRGASEGRPDALALAVRGADAHGVSIRGNLIHGTVQGITNTGGDGWRVEYNTVLALEVFDCSGARCGGGSAIVMQQREPGLRAWGNSVWLNLVTGRVPTALEAFDMVGVVLFGQDNARVVGNRVHLAADDSPALGLGVLASSTCCGGVEFSTSRDLIVVGNSARRSDFAVVIAPGNASGAFVAGNRGVVLVDEDLPGRALRAALPARPRPWP